MFGILGVYPEGVVVDMNRVGRCAASDCSVEFKRFATVNGRTQLGENVVNAVCIFGVGHNFGVVERSNGNIMIIIGFYPTLATIIGAQQCTFFRFHQCINPTGLRGRWRKGDAAQVAFGQAVFLGFLFPAFAAVPGDIHA